MRECSCRFELLRMGGYVLLNFAVASPNDLLAFHLDKRWAILSLGPLPQCHHSNPNLLLRVRDAEVIEVAGVLRLIHLRVSLMGLEGHCEIFLAVVFFRLMKAVLIDGKDRRRHSRIVSDSS